MSDAKGTLGGAGMLTGTAIVAPATSYNLGGLGCPLHGGCSREEMMAVRTPCRVRYMPLKNPAKWRKVPAYGAVIQPGALLPIKLPSDFEPDEDHTLRSLKERFPSLSVVLDLSNHCESLYAPVRGVLQSKLPCASKAVPTEAEVDAFIGRIREFRAPEGARDRDGAEDALPLIAVHCHYSFNRTGFFIAAYLVREHGLSVPEAVRVFDQSRPPGIKHAWFRAELARRYGSDEDVVAMGGGDTGGKGAGVTAAVAAAPIADE